MDFASKIFQTQPQKQIIELATVLENSLSSDDLEAETAQVILLQVSQSNFQDFVVKLSNILSDTSNSAKARKGAALQIRSSFIASEGEIQQLEYDQKWFCVNEDVRSLIKENVLKSLGTELDRPSPAASAIVTMAATEFPHNMWPDLLTILMDAITHRSNLEQKREASLDTIDYLCQEITGETRQVLFKNSSKILKSILTGMKDVNNRIVLAATKSLSHATELFVENFDDNLQRDYIMQTLTEVAHSPEVDIKVASLSSILNIVSAYYELMEAYIDLKIFPIIFEAMKSDIKEVRVKGIVFCRELCCLEEGTTKSGRVSKTPKSVEDEKKKKSTHVCDRGYLKRNLDKLLPIFMEMLTNHVKSTDSTPIKYDEKDDETWDILTFFLESLVNDFGDNNIRQYISVFVARNVKNADWRYRNAAVTALGLLLKGERENVKNLMPRLMDIILYDKNYEVRASAAHTIAEACVALQEGDINLKVLVQALLYELTDGPKVAIGICDAFSRLAFSGRGNITEYFEIIIPKLLRTICRADGNNRLRWDASIAVGYVVGQSPMKCYFTVHRAALMINDCLQDPADPCHSTESLSTLCVTVQTILKRLPQAEASQISNMIMCCLLETCSKLTVPLDKSVLRMISTLVKILQDKFEKYVESFQSTLVLALRKRHESAFAAVALLSDICHAVRFKILHYCNDVLPLLVEILQNNRVNRFLKEQVIATIGMIAVSIGPHFRGHLDIVITALVCLQSQVDKFRIDNSDFIRNQTEMHKYLLKAYLGIVQAFKSEEKTIIRIQRMLKPCVNSIIEVIVRIVQVHNGYMERFVPVCIEELNDLCSIFGSSILHLLDIQPVYTIITIAYKSELPEVKTLAALVSQKLEKLKTPIAPEASPSTKFYRRGVEFFLKQFSIRKLLTFK